MDLGTRIRHLREKLGMNRKELAHGIVSYSHLSNIESDRFVPGDDVLRLLAKKLQVPEDYLLLHNEKDEELEKLLDEINEALEVHEDTEKAGRLLEQIEEQYGERINSTEQEVYYYLLKCYSLLIEKEQRLSADLYLNHCVPFISECQLQYMCKKSRRVYHRVSFYYYYNKGSYEISYIHSYNYYKNCENLLHEGNAHFLFGKVEGKLYRYGDAINNSKIAIEKYVEGSYRAKEILAYVLLFANFYEMNQFQNAKEAISKALYKSKTYNYEKFIDSIYYNLGLINHIQGNYKEARKFYLMALSVLKGKNKFNYINLVYRSIIANYVNSNEVELANQYIKEAKQFCANESDNKVLDFFRAKTYYLKNEFVMYEKILSEAVDYCYKSKITIYIIDYAQDLADYYTETRQYKKASYYYKVSIDSFDSRYNKEKFKYIQIIE